MLWCSTVTPSGCLIENGTAPLATVACAISRVRFELRDGHQTRRWVTFRPMVNLADGSKVNAAPIEKLRNSNVHRGDRRRAPTGGWDVKLKVHARGLNSMPFFSRLAFGLRHGRGPDDVANPNSHVVRPLAFTYLTSAPSLCPCLER